MNRIGARSLALVVASAMAVGSLAGCQTARGYYYDAAEGLFGYTKRERLVDRVQTARDEQAKAKETFISAFEQFKALVNFDGGNLEATYNKFNKQFENCEAKANSVKKRIADVKNVGTAIFSEWDGDIAKIKDESLKAKNVKLREQSKASYDEMLARMDLAAAKMDPVVDSFRDRVITLKSTLNASAIASLKGEEISLGNDIDALIKEMEASIKEADEFIAQNKAAK